MSSGGGAAGKEKARRAMALAFSRPRRPDVLPRRHGRAEAKAPARQADNPRTCIPGRAAGTTVRLISLSMTPEISGVPG